MDKLVGIAFSKPVLTLAVVAGPAREVAFLIVLAGIIFLVMMWVAFAMSVNQRANRQATLIRVILEATRRQVPLPPTLLALSRTYGTWHRYRIVQLIELLVQGMPLLEALEECPTLVSPDQRFLLQLGMHSPILAETLQRDLEFSRRRFQFGQQFSGVVFYFAALLLVGCGFLAFLQTFIVPKLRAIFVRTPLNIAWTEGVSNWLAPTPSLIGFSILCLLIATMIYLVIHKFRWPKPSLIRQSIFDSERSTILRGLALGVSAALPAYQLIEAILKLADNSPRASRIMQVFQSDHARSMSDILHHAQVITQPESDWLKLAQRVNQLPQSLQLLADRYDRNRLFQLDLIVDVGRPFIVFLTSIGIGFVCYEMFNATIQLMRYYAD